MSEIKRVNIDFSWLQGPAKCGRCGSTTTDICNQNGCGFLESGNGESELDAQRLRADTAEADLRIWKVKACEAAERHVAAEQRIAEQNSLIEEMATEMTLAISDSQIRSAMTVIGRTRFLQILQAHNARIDAALNPKPERHYSDCATNNRGVPELLGPCDCGYEGGKSK